MSLQRIQLIVSGRVQGVGFRYHTKAEAERRGLVGWVKNLADGRVECVAEGPAAEVAQLEKWCGRGPETASVENVEILARTSVQALSFAGFEIRR